MLVKEKHELGRPRAHDRLVGFEKRKGEDVHRYHKELIGDKSHLDDSHQDGRKEPNDPSGGAGDGDKAVGIKRPEEDHAQDHKKGISLAVNEKAIN